MSRRSPTLTGFSLAFRRPALPLAEISWRWSFGAAVSVLLFLSFFEYLDTLPVAPTDRFLLGTGYPVFVLRALNHILSGSGPRVVAALLIVAAAFAAAWALLASWGRALTLQNVLAQFNQDPVPFRMRSLAALNFLRLAATIAAVVGMFGAAILGGMASPAKNPAPGSALLVFLLTAMLTCLAWAGMNWLLSVSAIFVVRDGEDAFGSLSAAVRYLRQHLGAVLAAGFWFGLARAVACGIACVALFFTLSLSGILPRLAVAAAWLLLLAIYFAVADLLYVGRLATYVWIAVRPEEIPVPALPLPTYAVPPATRVDPDDLILSDVPIS